MWRVRITYICLFLLCRGGVRGFSDLSSEKSEGQDYYTGGKASGMVVQDPQGRPSSNDDIVSQLMENARRYPILSLGSMP